MRFFIKGWPWIWLALATGAYLVEDGFDHLLGTAILGLSVGSVFSLVGLYLNTHLVRGRWRIPALGGVAGFVWVGYLHWNQPQIRLWGLAFALVLCILAGCLLQSVVYLFPGQKPLKPQAPTVAAEERWKSLGLTRITSDGAQVLAMQGAARPLRDFSHGGDTDQYLEFAPGDKVLASWIPGQLELFSTADGSSLGMLKDRGLVGFSHDGAQLLAVFGKNVERYTLPDLSRCTVESLDQTRPDWRSLGKGWVFSSQSGFTLSAEAPQSTISFPYHHRVCVAKGLLAIPGAHCVLLENLKGERLWESPDVGRDVTTTGFSPDGRRMAFGTMGASVFIVDIEALEMRQQCLADGEIRCLAVSKDGLVAVGCADVSSKIWVFRLSDGQPMHVMDCYSDTWAVAFSGDGKLVASGHENGRIQLWAREGLPLAQWVKVN